MAYIKIFGIKSTVKKAVDYITNPDKTDEQNLVSSYGCSPETADLEFAMTAKLGKDNVMEKGDNLAWYMIISFKPGEITDPHIAHEIATKIADATLKGKHEYVLSTHVDKDHVHCHLIFNATNFVDYHKYISMRIASCGFWIFSSLRRGASRIIRTDTCSIPYFSFILSHFFLQRNLQNKILVFQLFQTLSNHVGKYRIISIPVFSFFHFHTFFSPGQSAVHWYWNTRR